MSNHFEKKTMTYHKNLPNSTRVKYLTTQTSELNDHHVPVVVNDPLGDTYGINLKGNHLLNIQENHNPEFVALPSSGITTDAIAAGGQVDIKITRHNDRLKYRWLALTVTNIGEVDVSFSVFDIIDRISVRASGSSCELGTYHSDDTFIRFLAHLDPNRKGMLPLMNLSPTYDVLNVLGEDEVRTLYYPITDVLDNIAPVTSHLVGDLTFTIKFRSTRVTPSASLRLDRIVLRQGHAQLRDRVVSKYMENYDIGAHFNFIHPLRETKDIDLVANETVTIRMNGIKGMISHLYVTVQPLPLSTREYEEIQTLELQGSSGHCEGAPVNGEYNRLIQSHEYEFNNHDFFVQKNVYHLSFSAAPTLSHEGQMVGYHIFTGQEMLKLTMGSSLTTGSYRIEILGMMYRTAEIKKGALHIH